MRQNSSIYSINPKEGMKRGKQETKNAERRKNQQDGKL